jgi:zinc and cadmium transporter
MTNSTSMLVIYAIASILASLAGGFFPFIFQVTHTRLQTAISFIAGLMLGMALLHMIPHAAEETQSLDRAVAWALGGFLVMFFLQRMFHYHHHGEQEGSAAETACCGAHHAAPVSRKLSWLAVSLGLGFHSLLDGLALAAAVTIGIQNGVGWVGLGTALAVILHKPFDSMAVVTLMQADGRSASLRRKVNFVIALIAPLGMGLAVLGLGEVAESNHLVLGCALGFCGGGFLCIACSDLLPELHFHAHDQTRLSLALVAGLAVSILVGQMEPAGHGHDHNDKCENNQPTQSEHPITP